MSKLIVQITGQPGAGKSEASAHLRDNLGFTQVTVSSLIREYARSRNISLQERKDFLSAHASMLEELGKLSVVNAILDVPSDFIAVDGIRVPAHVKPLHNYGPVIALHCPQNIRFDRTLARKGPLDRNRLEDFVAEEEWESEQTDDYVQNTVTVMDMADYHIDSSRPFTDVIGDINQIVLPLLNKV